MDKEKSEHRISATALRTDTSEILGRVRHGNQVVVVEVHGVPSAVIKPYDEAEFKNNLVLSERDTRIFLDNLNNPPPPNTYLKKAVKRYLQRHA